MTSLNQLTLLEAFQGLREKKFSSEELTRSCSAQVESFDCQIKSLITVDKDGAIKQAKAFDQRMARGESLPSLAGIPLVIKDIFCTRGLKTTAGSKFLADYLPPFDATVVSRLKIQGAVILGKSNLDEFAMGGSTENSGFFPTCNPWDLTRVPGGSSGGSAAAVSADMAIYALGTDTGGSIRQPASFCGVSGLKVSYGRVSRYGVMAMTSSLDTIGPIGKSAADLAMILQFIAGRDHRDSTTPDIPVDDYSAEINQPVAGLKIGLPKEYFIEGMDAGIRSAVMAAAKKFEEMGAEIIDISLPYTDLAIAAYYIICPSEVSSNLARYDGIKYGLSERGNDLLELYLNSRSHGLGPEVKRRIMIGTYSLSAGYYDAYYKKAMQIRTLVKQDFEQVFEKIDAILTPVTPTPAFLLGENINNPLKMYLTDVFTVPASLAGICGLSIPAGFVDGLPIGIQILGKRFDEKTILRLGHHYQQKTDWHKQKPKLNHKK